MVISSRNMVIDAKRKKKKRKKNFISFYFTLFCLFVLYFGCMKGVSLVLERLSLFQKPMEISFEGESNREFSGTSSPDSPLAEEILSLREWYTDAKDIEDINRIVRNIDIYPVEFINLLFVNPEAVSFVANYPDYLAGAWEPPHTKMTDIKHGKYPLLIQWDPVWGYETYGASIMGLAGCGPTALSMALMGILDDASITPDQLAALSQQRGHVTEYNATSWSFFADVAGLYQVACEEIPLSEGSIYGALQQGRPIIVSMGQGDFTTSGHIILLTGIAENGEIIVNDPNSVSRSNRTWDISIFLNQSKNLWTLYRI